jgi:hypothetical protein
MKHLSHGSCRAAATSSFLHWGVLGLALVLAAGCAGCEGSAAPTEQPPEVTPPPTGKPDLPLPALAAPHGCSATLRELAVYQAVKAPLLKVGGAVVEPRTAAIIEGRQALFRAFLDLNAGVGGNVRGRLRLSSSQGVQVFDDEKAIAQDSTDTALATTLNFTVPAAAMQGDTAISFELDVGNSCAGGGVARFPPGEPMSLQTQHTGVLKLTLVPIRYDADGSGRMPDVSEAQIARYHNALMAVYPAQEVQITVHEPFSSTISLEVKNGWNTLLGSVRMLRQADKAPADVYYYALVSPAASFQTYCGRGSCTAGVSYLVADSVAASAQQAGTGIGFGGALAAETLIHEVGHQHGRPHTSCGDADGQDPQFPYPNGQIGVWGFDMYSGSFKPPIQVKDFMGYCTPQWISDYTFNQLANRATRVQIRSREIRGDVSGDALSGPGVSGKYRTLLVDGEQLNPAAQWGGLLGAGEQVAGDAEPAQVLDASGAVIAQVTVYRTRYGHGPGASFEVPEAQTGWHSLRLAGGQHVRYSRSATIPALRPIEVGGAPASLPGTLRFAPTP